MKGTSAKEIMQELGRNKRERNGLFSEKVTKSGNSSWEHFPYDNMKQCPNQC